jgi:HAD superfamily hydrolase (TIGR01459 family)
MFSSFLKSLKEIAHLYDVFIFDIWGVLHDGLSPFPYVIDALKELKKNKLIYLLSNAPRRAKSAKKKLEHFGIREELYTDIFTSGEQCHNFLRDRPNAFYQKLGTTFYQIGQDIIAQRLPYRQVFKEDFLKADFILATAYDSLELDFILSFDTKKPLICVNFDKTVYIGSTIVPCAGSLAALYEKYCDPHDIFYHGKPDISMFQTVHEMSSDAIGLQIDKKRILMCGDSLETDIKGANMFGIDSVLVQSGVHKAHQDNIEDFNKHFQAFPNYIISEISF